MQSTLSVREFFERYYSPTIKPTSRIDYDQQLKHVAAYWSAHLTDAGRKLREMQLGDLSGEHIHGAINWQLRRGRTRETADKVRRVLLAIWNRAADLEAIPAPTKRPRKLPQKKHEPTAWSVEDFERIVAGAARLPGPVPICPTVGRTLIGDWMPVPILLTYNSGLRVDSLMAIRWDWLDLSGRLLVIPPDRQKDDEGATITLLPSVVDRLRFLRERSETAEVFGDWPHDRSQIPWPALTRRLRWSIVLGGLRGDTSSANQSELRAAFQSIGRRDLWHRLRRTFATEMYAKTHDIELVREMLGHSSIQVTYRYVDKSKIGRRLQAETLDDVGDTEHTLRVIG